VIAQERFRRGRCPHHIDEIADERHQHDLDQRADTADYKQADERPPDRLCEVPVEFFEGRGDRRARRTGKRIDAGFKPRVHFLQHVVWYRERRVQATQFLPVCDLFDADHLAASRVGQTFTCCAPNALNAQQPLGGKLVAIRLQAHTLPSNQAEPPCGHDVAGVFVTDERQDHLGMGGVGEQARRQAVAERRWNAQRLKDKLVICIIPLTLVVEVTLQAWFATRFSLSKGSDDWLGVVAFAVSVMLILLMTKERRAAEIALKVAYGMDEADAIREVKSWDEHRDSKELGLAIFRSPFHVNELPYLGAHRRLASLEPVVLLVGWVSASFVWLSVSRTIGYEMPLVALLFLAWLLVVYRLARKECKLAKQAIDDTAHRGP
jgi:hypothetical protein